MAAKTLLIFRHLIEALLAEPFGVGVVDSLGQTVDLSELVPVEDSLQQVALQSLASDRAAHDFVDEGESGDFFIDIYIHV